MHAHVIKYLPAYLLPECIEAAGQLVYYLTLNYNYPSHILTEPGKCTVFHLMFELFKISRVSIFLFCV